MRHVDKCISPVSSRRTTTNGTNTAAKKQMLRQKLYMSLGRPNLVEHGVVDAYDGSDCFPDLALDDDGPSEPGLEADKPSTASLLRGWLDVVNTRVTPPAEETVQGVCSGDCFIYNDAPESTEEALQLNFNLRGRLRRERSIRLELEEKLQDTETRHSRLASEREDLEEVKKLRRAAAIEVDRCDTNERKNSAALSSLSGIRSGVRKKFVIKASDGTPIEFNEKRPIAPAPVAQPFEPKPPPDTKTINSFTALEARQYQGKAQFQKEQRQPEVGIVPTDNLKEQLKAMVVKANDREALISSLRMDLNAASMRSKSLTEQLQRTSTERDENKRCITRLLGKLEETNGLAVKHESEKAKLETEYRKLLDASSRALSLFANFKLNTDGRLTLPRDEVATQKATIDFLYTKHSNNAEKPEHHDSLARQDKLWRYIMANNDLDVHVRDRIFLQFCRADARIPVDGDGYGALVHGVHEASQKMSLQEEQHSLISAASLHSSREYKKVRDAQMDVFHKCSSGRCSLNVWYHELY